MADLIIAPSNPGPIKIPAWDDVVHIAPRPVVEPDQRKIWNLYLDSIDARSLSVPPRIARERIARALITAPPDLPADVVAELRRKREMYLQRRETAIPGWRQKLIGWLTQLDNLEDDISTALWLGGPLLRMLPGGRIIEPIARGTTTALNRVEAVLRGPSISGRSGKDTASRERMRNMRATRGKLGVLAKGAQWLAKNWGHLLEAGQSADTHLGVGLSLGPIYGAIEEATDRGLRSAWAAAKYVRAAAAENAERLVGRDPAEYVQMRDEATQELRRVGLPVAEQIERMIPRAMMQFAPIPTLVYRSIEAMTATKPGGPGFFARTINRAQAILGIARDNPDYSLGEHALALLAANSSTPLPADLWHMVARTVRIGQILELPIPRPRVTNPVTLDLLTDAGCRLNLRDQPIAEWAAPEKSVETEINESIDAYTRNHSAWLRDDVAEPTTQMMHCLAEDALHGAAVALTGRTDGITLQYPADVRAEMYLYDTGEYPPRDIGADDLAAWMRDQVAAHDAAPDDYTMRMWRAVTARHWPTSQ